MHIAEDAPPLPLQTLPSRYAYGGKANQITDVKYVTTCAFCLTNYRSTYLSTLGGVDYVLSTLHLKYV